MEKVLGRSKSRDSFDAAIQLKDFINNNETNSSGLEGEFSGDFSNLNSRIGEQHY